MTSVAPAIPPAPLFYRSLQKDLSIALAQGTNSTMSLVPFSGKKGGTGAANKPPTAMEWLIPPQNIKIESDVALIGWGATSNNVQTDIQLHVHGM